VGPQPGGVRLQATGDQQQGNRRGRQRCRGQSKRQPPGGRLATSGGRGAGCVVPGRGPGLGLNWLGGRPVRRWEIVMWGQRRGLPGKKPKEFSSNVQHPLTGLATGRKFSRFPQVEYNLRGGGSGFTFRSNAIRRVRCPFESESSRLAWLDGW
jgi:ribosome modulation factor